MSTTLPENSSSGSMVTLLEPMTFPLHGARLIEASAGTGKTFTIASLYLRLLLGHGGNDYGFGRPLTVEQILVVTFTEAATAELKGRIRQRIHDARIAFARGESKDPVIKPLLLAVSDHRSAAQLLLDAEREMDSAAIYTIHGFCQRMLVQNAFESGARFNNEFITDETRLKSQVVADYWRRYFYPLPAHVVKLIRSYWPTPEDLCRKIAGFLSGKVTHLSVAPFDSDLVTKHDENLSKIADIKRQWQEQKADALSVMEQANLDKRSYSSRNLPNWFNKVSDWAEQATDDYFIPEELVRFSLAELATKTKSGAEPQHELFTRIEQFLSEPISLKSSLLSHAIDRCRAILAETKKKKQWLSFDDLLGQLSAALDTDQQGVLASRVRELYPIAMIDEFQDTDPLQYSIFSRIYLPRPSCGLFMIGDPKQAIYAFRGADIFTYILARNQVVDHYTLGTNWRSSDELIESVNQLFVQASKPFIYDQDIPFHPVGYAPSASSRRWYLNGEPQPAMTLWCAPQETLCSRADYQQQMANATAAQIQTVLTLSQNGGAQLSSMNESKPIAANHIAVLVRTGKEGQLVKRTLASRGIASVYLSNQDSVFTSLVAADVSRLLQAVHLPDDEHLVRAVLASALFGLPIRYLDELNYDESLWESVNLEFRNYRKIWQQRGVLPMLRAVVNQRHLAQNWLAVQAGERYLTDYLHLSELLQEASIEMGSDVALIRWLSQAIEDAQAGIGGGDEQIQRLESESNLVQIVTIHKSKGLEYDLVFLPFSMSYRSASEAKYHDADCGEMVVDINDTPEKLELADRERLAEDLRLLYVALTRAVYGCYIGVAPLAKPNARKMTGDSGAHHSAFGYLLQRGQAGDARFFAERLELFVENTKSAVIVAPPQISSELYSPAFEPQPELTLALRNHSVERSWRMTSYSNLVKQSSHSSPLAVELEVPGLDVDSAEEVDDVGIQEDKSIFTFPRGARPGTFLHSLFEQIEFTEPVQGVYNTNIILELMDREQVDREWVGVLINLVEKVLSVPLDGQQLTLASKSMQQRLVEMEFLLPIALLNAPQLNRIIRCYDPLSARASDLGFIPVQGMLKGFIDLVFEHQGRYYILDWKSNHLGYHCDDYNQARVEQAMIEHRYDLQYQIYTVALHRFLASRIPDYDYETHFGGVYYVFLRGVSGQDIGGQDSPSSFDKRNGIFYSRPDVSLVAELDAWINGKAWDASLPIGQMELDL
jgi:exodeoxyribonuclease V beta subunit